MLYIRFEIEMRRELLPDALAVFLKSQPLSASIDSMRRISSS